MHRILRCLVASAGLASAAVHAHTIVVSDASNGLPHRLTEFTAEGQFVADLGVPQGPWAPTFDFATADTAYYITRASSSADTTPFDGLFRFDTTTGMSSLVTTIDTAGAYGAGSLAYHDGTVYWLARGEDPAQTTLYAFDDVDEGSPTMRTIGDTGVDNLAGIAVNPNTGDIYTIRDIFDPSGTFIFGAEVHSLDADTGEASFVVDAPHLSGLTIDGGMDYSPDGEYILLARNFYTGGPGDFVVLDAFDPLTGEIVFDTENLTRSGGLAAGDISFRVPGPGAGALAILAIGALARRRR